MISKIGMGLLVLIYLLTMARFAFRPFQWVPGKYYPEEQVERRDGAVHLLPGAALEDRRNVDRVRKTLMDSGRVSLEVVLKTDSLTQGGPARIVSFSRNAMSRNFTLAQEGHALVFRLRTSRTDHNGMLPELIVPGVFDDSRFQHLVVVYNGATVRLYVDGKLHPMGIELAGDFGNWGRNHALVFGDEVPGGRPWSGRLQRVAVYDRNLDANEVETLFAGNPVSPPILAEDFQTLERLRYRNLFIDSDPSAYSQVDCVANIIGFIPLAGLVWLVFPKALKKRGQLAVWLVPAMLGFAASLSIELVQRFVGYRVPCLLDLVYNMLGTLLGCLLLWLLLRCTQWIRFGKGRI